MWFPRDFLFPQQKRVQVWKASGQAIGSQTQHERTQTQANVYRTQWRGTRYFFST
jgi:hypothetical protein